MIDTRAPVEPTSMSAPYDVLRAVRCRRITNGVVCNRPLGEIDWSTPQTDTRTCLTCKTVNVTHILEAAPRG
jgi:hypothetical protein